MKNYTFPVGGSLGKHETWDGEMNIDISDRDAARMEASAKRKPRRMLEDDVSIIDVYWRVRKKIFNEQKKELESVGRLKELREFDPDASDDELVEEEMGSWDILLPEELQGEEMDDEEE